MTAAHAVLNELQLKRTPGDRRLYALDGVGTLRLTGWARRAVTAEAGALSWQIKRCGFWQRVIQAADAAGTVVGEYEARARRGGALRWCDSELALRPDSVWRERYALVEGDRRLATIEGKSSGKRPLNISVDDNAAAIDPGLLLFAAYVVWALARDAAATTSTAVS